MPLALHEALGDQSLLVAELLMSLNGGGRCCLVVEGPDDISLLQEFKGKECRLIQAGDRKSVWALVRAVRGQESCSEARDRIIGLFDRDFDHVSYTEPIPTGLAHTTPGFNDIETALLYHNARPVLAGFVDLDSIGENDWLRAEGEAHLDPLVDSLVAVVGAFRAAYKPLNRGKFGDDSIVLCCWDAIRGMKIDAVDEHRELVLDRLVKHLPQAVGMNREIVRRDAERLLGEARGDMLKLWGLVRGKDLVGVIAAAVLASNARLHTNPSHRDVGGLRARLSERLRAKADVAVLKQCGVVDAVESASKSDTRRFRYLELC